MEDAGDLGRAMSSEYYESIDVTTCTCKICGSVTINIETALCNSCWEIQSRIDTYLRHPAGYEDIVARVVKARFLKKDKNHVKN